MKHAPAALAIALLLALPAAARAALNDTGQTQCYSATAAAACTSAPGQDGRYGRDAQAAGQLPAKAGGGEAGFDFTALDGVGAPASPGSHACVRDNVTGLVWSAETEDNLTWPAAVSAAVSAAASYSHCGLHTGWRLPTRRELLSIVHRGRTSPAIEPTYLPAVLAGYWSADHYAPDAAVSWYVLSSNGDTNAAHKATPGQARFVHGASTAAAFVPTGSGTVADGATALEWDQCYLGQAAAHCDAAVTAITYGWQAALLAAAQLNARPGGYKGHTDWRLPNAAELESLVDLTAASGAALDITAFPGASPGDLFWSSTTYLPDPAFAWTVDFHTGATGQAAKTGAQMVRLVRGGAPFAAFEAQPAAPPAPPTATPVPTLGHAALALLAGLLGAAGFISHRRKRF